MKNKIKKGSNVKVIAGKDKGKEGIVLDMLRKNKSGRVIVSGIQLAHKHKKPSGKEAGKVIQKEMPIHISNIKLIS